MSDDAPIRPPAADRRVPALTDDVVAGWMAGQRWYAAKGLAPELRVIARVDVDRDGTTLSTRFVIDDAPAEPVLYQVPLTIRTAPDDALEHALVATDGERWMYDAPHDPLYAGWLVDTVVSGGSAAGDAARVEGTPARNTATGAQRIGPLRSAAVLTGEQSNTSVICTIGRPATTAAPTSAAPSSAAPSSAPTAAAPGGTTTAPGGTATAPGDITAAPGGTATAPGDTTAAPGDTTAAPGDTNADDLRIIVKVFRVLHHGDNPDVTTQAALSDGGSARVPHSYGALAGTWPDVGRTDGTATGHLAFAQEFLPGLEDAWRVALRAARSGSSFVDPAGRLGATLAEVHAVLADTLPTVAAGPDEIASGVASMRDRLALAAREVPAVAEHADAIGRLYDALPGLAWPSMQRVHGDLHLGQVLAAEEPRGWVFLDFEGEPLRPMPERSRPDSPLRDVAGMLRSFDYVAGSLARETPPVDTGTWAHEARHAFVDGYERASGTDVRAQRALLDAFEIDKAVYEAVYESRNRPTWIAIPVDAVARLVARSAR